MEVVLSLFVYWFIDLASLSNYSARLETSGNTYDTEFEIVADGWVFRLKSAYSKAPRLYTRRLGAQEEGELFEKRKKRFFPFRFLRLPRSMRIWV